MLMMGNLAKKRELYNIMFCGKLKENQKLARKSELKDMGSKGWIHE